MRAEEIGIYLQYVAAHTSHVLVTPCIEQAFFAVYPRKYIEYIYLAYMSTSVLKITYVPVAFSFNDER